MITVQDLAPADLTSDLGRLWAASGPKVSRLLDRRVAGDAAPVFTVDGRYTARGWTDWTEGFLYGWAVLHFDATGDEDLLAEARSWIDRAMPDHVTNAGVHDHGFNTISTFGNLRRLGIEGRVDQDARAEWELAIRVSGAVQAMRWTPIADGGFIHSFNGPHSLFSDTIRSLRVLVLADQLGHRLLGEGDRPISLLARAHAHARATATYNVFYGEGRDIYDERGRVAHEGLFNTTDGSYRCPSTQQGYSPFSTWTRGQAWVLLGFAEQLEFMADLRDGALDDVGGREEVIATYRKAAEATAEHYLSHTPTDGVPYWDTGAPGLVHLPPPGAGPADPFNHYEPVDSSTAAIAAQGLLRLGRAIDEPRYVAAGLTITRTLLDAPYLSTDDDHEGLLLHGVYHRPNGWDRVPDESGVPRGEAVMWGDYHLMELGVLVQRLAGGGPYPTFYGGAT